jgi:hypothetical protein
VRVELHEIGMEGVEASFDLRWGRSCRAARLVDEYGEPVREPGAVVHGPLTEEEIRLQRTVVDRDRERGVGRRQVAEETENPPEFLGNRPPLGPELVELSRLGNDDEIEVGKLVAFAPAQRARQQQRAYAVVLLGPGARRVHDGGVRSRKRYGAPSTGSKPYASASGRRLRTTSTKRGSSASRRSR